MEGAALWVEYAFETLHGNKNAMPASSNTIWLR